MLLLVQHAGLPEDRNVISPGSVSRVKLVAYPGASIRTDKIEAAEVHTPARKPAAVRPVRKNPGTRLRVESRSQKKHARAVIPLKKRKRALKRVSIPKKKKIAAKPKRVKKKPDPEEFIRKKLAAIRERVEKEKRSKSRNPVAEHINVSRSDESAAGQGLMDAETVKWFGGVRSRINSHWSILVDRAMAGGVTIVGVTISDEGDLLDASVDRSSGDKILDLCAIRAVHKAAPFPRMPAKLREKIKDAGGLALRFTPNGLL